MKLPCLLLAALCSFTAFAQSGGPSAGTGANTGVNTAWLWRQAVGGAVIGRPAVQAQSVVVALDGGSVKAYSASGRPLWSFFSRGRLSPYVTRSREGTSYICRTTGVFIAVSRIGKELWRVDAGGTLSGPVVIGWDGRLFVPTARAMLCYTASGSLLWRREIAGAVSAGPWLDQGGGVLLALENNEALRIGPYGAVTVLKLPASARLLLSSGPLVMAMYHNGDVQLLDLSRPDAPPVNAPRLPSPPLAAASRGNTVAAALANGQLMLMTSNGTARWSADTHIRALQQRGRAVQESDAAVIYDERGIYVLSASGASAFNAEGRRLWFTTLNNASGVPAFDDNGVLYSGGTDWILYTWKLEERAARQQLTLYGPAPEGIYGRGVYPSVTFSGYEAEAEVRGTLNAIEKDIQAGRVGENERDWLGYLMSVAESSDRQGMFPISMRVTALQLLSRIGSGETMPWLTRFFKAETEPLVKAAAARAIGAIGLDPNGLAIQELLAAAIEGNVHDERVLVAVAAAAGSLCRFSGPPLFDSGARLLVLLSHPDRPQSVRRQARSELERLME